MQAVQPVPDSEFPDWERLEPPARTVPPAQAQPDWALWAGFVLFCLGPALGFCLAQWW